MKILFLVSRFPYPLEKGDKLRAFQHIVNLHGSGHEVILVALSDQAVDEKAIGTIRQYCHSMHILRMSKFDIVFNLANAFIRKLPLQVAYFYSGKNQRTINRIIINEKPDVIYCQLIRTALYVKNISTITKVIDYQDAFSKGTGQRTERSSPLYKPLFKRELKLVTKFEIQSYEWFDEHLIISEQDRNSLGFPSNLSITIIPNGIDTGFFKPIDSEKEFDITFVGNMNYPPNVDACLFLVKEIMPLVWKKIPNATVQLAGANPTRKVQLLASGKIVVTGWVDDIRDCYRKTKVFIAPMRIGTGLQNKLLEAMAMKIPCVSTELSFEPLGASKNEEVLVGSTAEELARHLIRLLNDRELSESVAGKGADFIVARYSMKHSQELLKMVFEQVVTPAKS